MQCLYLYVTVMPSSSTPITDQPVRVTFEIHCLLSAKKHAKISYKISGDQTFAYTHLGHQHQGNIWLSMIPFNSSFSGRFRSHQQFLS